MTLIKTVLIIFLLFFISCDSSTRPKGVEPVDKYLNIQGIVMDASWAYPVAEAVVRFQRMDGAYTIERKTDASGKFFSLFGYVDSCEDIGNFRVQVIKEDYVTTELLGGVDSKCDDEAQFFIFDLYRTEDYGKENQVVIHGYTHEAVSQERIGGVHVQVYIYYEGREECENLPIVITYSSSDSLNLGYFRIPYTWQWCTRDLYIIFNAPGYEQTAINYGLIGSQIRELYITPFLYPTEP